jgi:hypothetical protein
MMRTTYSTAQVLGTLREAKYRPLTMGEILAVANHIADLHDEVWPDKKSQRLNEKMQRILDGKVVI